MKHLTNFYDFVTTLPLNVGFDDQQRPKFTHNMQNGQGLNSGWTRGHKHFVNSKEVD